MALTVQQLRLCATDVGVETQQTLVYDTCDGFSWVTGDDSWHTYAPTVAQALQRAQAFGLNPVAVYYARHT